MRYRENEPLYRDVWDWDILLLHGDVKIIGRSDDHLDHCDGLESVPWCTCGEGQPKISSPVVDKNGRELKDGGPYSAVPTTGEGRLLLDACDGTEIAVLSGKTYRLRGERGHHDSYATGSIWNVYREPEAEVKMVKMKFWQWVRRLWSAS